MAASAAAASGAEEVSAVVEAATGAEDSVEAVVAFAVVAADAKARAYPFEKGCVMTALHVSR